MRRLRLALAILAPLLNAQDWPYYGGDSGGARYSKLKQINKSNVSRLQVAWTYRTGDISDGSKYPVKSPFENTPLMVDGVLYIVTAFNRLIALDSETGRELWAFDPKLNLERPQMLFTHRGAAYWSDGERKRLYYGTLEGQLWSIDALTGKPVAGFGDGGRVDLAKGMVGDPAAGQGRGYGMTSPPAIYRDVVICGAYTADSSRGTPSGDVRAFDIHTGKLVWRFHVLARPGEPGGETWEGDAALQRGGGNMWSIPSVDEKLGLVYLPLTSPAADGWGGDRKGANLFSDSLVAVDALTGKRVWHFQTTHHDLWDYDLPAQPNLVQVRHGGKMIDAVAQVTKMGLLFLFDRSTGKPLFDVEERPVPQSDVPGEFTFPTQPFPVKPPPFSRQTFRREDLTDVTPESRAFCEKLIEGAVLGDLYTPIGLKRTIVFPGTNGGPNWGGASYDPETRTLFVNSMDVGQVRQFVKGRPGASIPYSGRGVDTYYSRFWDAKLNPCQKPPWGHLTAIDLDKGEFRWRSTLGVVDELAAKGVPPTGTSNLGGSIVTAGGLVFIGATNDSRFRAFDKYTGKELWVTKLPASAHATPMTYLTPKTRKQVVVIAAGGGNKYNSAYSDALVAYWLP